MVDCEIVKFGPLDPLDEILDNLYVGVKLVVINHLVHDDPILLF